MKKINDKKTPTDKSHWRTIKNPLIAYGPEDTFARLQFDYTNQTPPAELFHYTSEESFLALANSGVMWATESSYLNDKTELTAGLEVFKEALNNIDSSHFVLLTTEVLDKCSTSDWLYFVISLSERGDMLSQWRAYAGDATGCVVGLSGKSIKERAGFGEFLSIDADDFPNEVCHFFHLLKVIYDNGVKRKFADDFLEEAKKCYDSIKDGCAESDLESNANYMAYCTHRLREFIVSFKSEEFVEEAEWRIVASMHCKDLSIGYRSTSYGIAPFTMVNISERKFININRLPITRIILGPKGKSRGNPKGFHLLLRKLGYEVPVEQSNSSFR